MNENQNTDGMKSLILYIILLDSDAVTELIYELFWRYLDSNLDEAILIVQLSTIQKVVFTRIAHFLVYQSEKNNFPEQHIF